MSIYSKMNKEKPEYKCNCCDYITNLKTNLTRHITNKHSVENAELIALRSENIALKAEIEALKNKHIIDLLQQKCEILQSVQPAMLPRRQSITPTKKEIPIPENVITCISKEPFRKKKSGEKTLDYLNKFYDPTNYPVMIHTICTALCNTKVELSQEDVNIQWSNILKPIIRKHKLIFHSGSDGRTHKLYYVNDEQKWTENLNYLQDIQVETKPDLYRNIYNMLEDKFTPLMPNLTDDEMDIYKQIYFYPDEKKIITLLLDTMELPEESNQ